MFASRLLYIDFWEFGIFFGVDAVLLFDWLFMWFEIVLLLLFVYVYAFIDLFVDIGVPLGWLWWTLLWFIFLYGDFFIIPPLPDTYYTALVLFNVYFIKSYILFVFFFIVPVPNPIFLVEVIRPLLTELFVSVKF
jgi:hypothetical protein